MYYLLQAVILLAVILAGSVADARIGYFRRAEPATAYVPHPDWSTSSVLLHLSNYNDLFAGAFDVSGAGNTFYVEAGDATPNRPGSSLIQGSGGLQLAAGMDAAVTRPAYTLATSAPGYSAFQLANSWVTMGCWLYALDGNNGRYMLSAADEPTMTKGYALLIDDGAAGQYLPTFKISHGSGVASCPGTAVIVYGQGWAHLVGRYASGEADMFVYGVDDDAGCATGLSGAPVMTDQDVHIGKWQGTAGALNGGAYAMVDECFFSDAGLTDDTICTICACGWDGSLCTCDGSAYVNKGRNLTCGSCLNTVTEPCNQATPGTLPPPTTTSTVTTTVTTSTVTTTTLAGNLPDWSTDIRLKFLAYGEGESAGDDLADSSAVNRTCAGESTPENCGDAKDGTCTGGGVCSCDGDCDNTIPDVTSNAPTNVVLRGTNTCSAAICFDDGDCVTGECLAQEGSTSIGENCCPVNNSYFQCTDAECPIMDQEWVSFTAGGWVHDDSTGGAGSGFSFVSKGGVAGQSCGTSTNGFAVGVESTTFGDGGCVAVDGGGTFAHRCESLNDITESDQWNWWAGRYDAKAGPYVFSNGLEAIDPTKCDNVREASPTSVHDATPNIGDNFQVFGDNTDGWMDEIFFYASTSDNSGGLSAESMCRICSCGWKNQRNCVCSGSSWVYTGVNAYLCNSCKLPACNTSAPIATDYAEDHSQGTTVKGWYRFEEPTSSSNALDSSASGNDLIISGTVLRSTGTSVREGTKAAGNFGITAYFKCASGDGCYTDLDIDTGEITLCSWVYTANDTLSGWVAGKIDINTDSGVTGFGIFKDATNDRFRAFLGDGTTSYVVSTADNSVLDESVHHVCMRWDGSNELSIFLNGQKIAAQTGVTALGANNFSFRVASSDDGDHLGQGRLDDVTVVTGDFTDAYLCRMCSCGISNHRGCACNVDDTWSDKGVNATLCNSCVLPTNCDATAPEFID